MYTGYNERPRSLLPRPGYLVPISENGFKNTIIRVCNDAKTGPGHTGTAIPVPVVGGTWKGDWSRGRYSKRQAWNADGTQILIEQKYSGSPSRIVLSNATLLPIWGSLISGATPGAGTAARKLKDATEVQWRPGFPTQMVSVKQITTPVQGIEVEVFDIGNGSTVGSKMQINCTPYTIAACNLGWIGEGIISDNGQWTAFCTELARPQDDAGQEDFIIIVDLKNSLYSVKTDVTAATNLYPNGNGGEIGHCSISCLGNYVALSLKGSTDTVDASGTYAAQPTFVYKVNKATDWATVAMLPEPMHASGLRMPNAAAWADTTSGLIAFMSHSDMNIDSLGREVLVGGAREMGLSNAPVPPLGSGTDAQKRARIPKFYGYCISIDLATGTYVHVSPGQTQVGREVAGVQHTSGVAYKRRGWHCITTDMENLGRWGSSELQMVYLGGTNSTTGVRKIERWCHLHTDDSTAGHPGSPPSGYSALKYNSEAHGHFNPLGTVGMFASNWMIDANPTSTKGPFDNKGYIVKHGSSLVVSGSGGLTVWPA